MKKGLWKIGLACLLLGTCFSVACKNKPVDGDITVYMPDGAPALAFAKLLHEDKAEDGVSYFVSNAGSIEEKVTYHDADKNADFCVLPLTQATAKVGDGETYQMVGAVTHGNLYFISKNVDVEYTKENLSTLKGKTVGVLQLGNTPGLIFKSMLLNNGIDYNDLTVENATVKGDKVNLTPIIITAGAKPAQVLSVMEGQGVDLFVMAEPAVTALQNANYKTVGNVQTLYGEEGYTQAVLVAKKTVLEEKTEWVKAFLADVKESAIWATTANKETLVSAVQSHMEVQGADSSLKGTPLTGEVFLRSGVRFESAYICKAKTEAFLQTAKRVENKTVLPNEQFYWLG